jgi:hypothetical protein
VTPSFVFRRREERRSPRRVLRTYPPGVGLGLVVVCCSCPAGSAQDCVVLNGEGEEPFITWAGSVLVVEAPPPPPAVVEDCPPQLVLDLFMESPGLCPLSSSSKVECFRPTWLKGASKEEETVEVGADSP